MEPALSDGGHERQRALAGSQAQQSIGQKSINGWPHRRAPVGLFLEVFAYAAVLLSFPQVDEQKVAGAVVCDREEGWGEHGNPGPCLFSFSMCRVVRFMGRGRKSTAVSLEGGTQIHVKRRPLLLSIQCICFLSHPRPDVEQHLPCLLRFFQRERTIAREDIPCS